MGNEIKIINTSSIKPHPQNHKIYDTKGKTFREGIESLKLSISKMGLLEPLVVNKKNVLLSGHRRFLSIKELGIKKCEVRVVDVENELYVLIHSNRQRVKSDDEIAREIKIIGEELLKERKLGRPSKDGKTKPKGPIRKQIAETLGVSEGKIQYIKRKEIELQEIKMHDKKVYEDVKDKPYKHIKDAHNKVMGNINMVKVWKGAGTKVKKDLSRDWDLFVKKHKLKGSDGLKQIYALLMKQYPYTLKTELEKYLK